MKTLKEQIYSILYEKSKLSNGNYGVRILYEEDFPLKELLSLIKSIVPKQPVNNHINITRKEGFNQCRQEIINKIEGRI